MKKVTFQTACTTTRMFTKAQMEKVQDGIAIFNEVMASATFKKMATAYNWTNNNGTVYNRFHMSRGMSNKQVFDCMMNCTTWCEMNTKSTTNWIVNVMPCCTAEEMNNAMMMNSMMSANMMTNMTNTNAMTTMPTVWMNVNWLNNNQCTAVHVASCIMHEYCMNLGFCCHWNGMTVENWMNTVPAACGRMVMEVCETMSSNKMIAKCMTMVDSTNYSYYPCSSTFNATTNWMNMTSTNCTSNCMMMDEMISNMEMELNCLEQEKSKNSEVVNRITVLTNACNSMKEMKMRFMATSLDGCDAMGMAVAQREMTVIG